MLTETTVRASDKRAVFVGIEGYEAAGGIVLRDLFQSDDGGWLQDPALLDRLVAENLKTAADEIAGEGWKWVEASLCFPYGHEHGLRALVGVTVDLTEEERATREALREEYDRLEAEYSDAIHLSAIPIPEKRPSSQAQATMDVRDVSAIEPQSDGLFVARASAGGTP